MKTTLFLVALLAVLVILATFGVPTWGDVTWDNSSNLARIASQERLELARLAHQDAESARRNDTLHWLILAGVAVLATRLCYGAVSQWIAYRRHRSDNQAAVMLAALPILQRRPGAYLDCVDGAWYVVDDKREELIPVERRLNGEIR